MTEKRFIVKDRWIEDNYIGALLNIDFNTITDANLCCDLLNQIEKEKRYNGKLVSKLLEENEQLKNENQKLDEKICLLTMDLIKTKSYEQLEKELNRIKNENEQLKQRNENQYNQLTELWQIIEEENWEKLIAMKKQLKEDEERLRNEWKCYE